MNAALHAFLAKRLIDACGGTKGSAVILEMSEGNVSRFKDHRYGQVLRADQIAELEHACKEPLYSRAMLEAIEPPLAGDLPTEACEATEAAADLQRMIRLALNDGRLSPREIDRIRAAAMQACEQVREVVTAVDGAG